MEAGSRNSVMPVFFSFLEHPRNGLGVVVVLFVTEIHSVNIFLGEIVD